MRHTSDPHTEAQDAIFAFLMHQAIELARDCLDKSQEEQISHNYFTQLSEKLRILAEDVSRMSKDTQQNSYQACLGWLISRGTL